MRLNLKENVEFPFADPEWFAKIAKLSVYYFVSIFLLMIPIPAVMGYQLEVIRQAAGGEDEKMPEFGPNLGAQWVQGFVISLFLAAAAMIPIMGIVAVGVGGAMAFQDNEALSATVAIGAILVGLFVMFMIAILMPAFMLRYAMTGSVSGLLDFGAIINDVKQGPSDYAVIVLIPLAGQFIATAASATGIGILLVIPITVLSMIIQARMLGNYYRTYFH